MYSHWCHHLDTCMASYHVIRTTVYSKKCAHGFVVLCFVVVMQSFKMNSHKVFIHIHQGCFAGTGAIVRLPQCQWSKPDGYGKISQCITTTKHSKAKTVCIFLGIYCITDPTIIVWQPVLHHQLVLRQITYVLLFYIIAPYGYDSISSTFLAFRYKTIARLCQL